MSHFLAILFVFSCTLQASAMDFKSCKNSKQIQFLMEDLKLAISQKLLSNDELKSLDKKKTCESFQIHAEALLKLASERAAAQSENVAEEEP